MLNAKNAVFVNINSVTLTVKLLITLSCNYTTVIEIIINLNRNYANKHGPANKYIHFMLCFNQKYIII